MKQLPLLLLLATLITPLLITLRPVPANAQAEPTPILGDPVAITPLATSAAGGEQDDSAATPAGTPRANSETEAPSAPALGPNVCEPNNTPQKACVLPLDAVSGPFTVVPENDQDFYRLDLPQEPSIQTLVTVRATEGLDLLLSARQGDALVASGTFSLTLAPSVVGPVLLRVENRDPRPAAGEQYRVEVRREIAPPATGAAAGSASGQSDSLENNWFFDTASAVAVGVVYDLSFVCPDPRPNACPGGDHDYLLVPVKKGAAYLLTTFDLDPGVDTVIELFWGSTTTAIAGNDDYAPGGTLSALQWIAPSDGVLGIRIASRNGGLAQHLQDSKAGYRFAVAPLASELARKLEATIRQQANVPTPTPTTAPAPSSAGSSSPGSSSGSNSGAASVGVTTAQESIAAGPALVTRETVLRREPNERSTPLATLAPEAPVQVRGPVSGLWVSVESDASILPGWVRAADLRRVSDATTGTPAVPGTTATAPASQQSGAATAPAQQPTAAGVSPTTSTEAAGREVVVQKLDDALPPPPPAAAALVPFTLSVVVAASDRPASTAPFGLATPTPDLRQPVARVRVQLVNAFGDLLAEGLTDEQGEAQLRRDIRPHTALSVRFPAWGVELPLAPEQTRLVVTVPEVVQ